MFEFLLEVEDLTKRYGDSGVLALEGLNLHLDQGEIYGLLGSNGAGKTTTINLCLGYIEPTKGRIRVAGVDVHTEPLEAKRHLSYVPENVQLYGDFTAMENLSYFTKLSGTKRSKGEFLQILRDSGLEEQFFRKNVRSFSKGMRQKVAIAIAMAKEASVILLDEPTSGLDPSAAREFMDVISQLGDSGQTVLMSTHDIFRIKDVATRVGIMKWGCLGLELTRQELAGSDLEEIYLDYMGGDRESSSRNDENDDRNAGAHTGER